MSVSPPAGMKTNVTEEQYQRAKQYLLPRLQAELPAHLTYHNADHVLSVIDATAYLADKEEVPEDDRWLLITAALYHDAGFLRGYENHEEFSCDIAWETLPPFGYSDDSIEKICRLIMVTKLPQTPSNLYENILCDADLFYLGTSSFSSNAYALYKEYLSVGQVKSEEEWQAKQLMFLDQHRYFTGTAMAENEPRKKALVRQLLERQERLFRKSPLDLKARETIHDFFYMVLGVLVAGFALKSFLVPHHFFDGGITGISLLLHELYHYNLTTTIIIANLPLVALAYFTVSKKFGIKTFLCVVLFGLCLTLNYPAFPAGERILLSIFGGFFLGVGIGLCMRAGCTLDGVEVLALKTFKRTPFTVTEVILAMNILIFCVAAFHPKLGPMTALYSIVTYFTASRSIDFVVEGIEAYNGVTIISAQSELLKYRIVNELGRGITVYKGERGFLPGQFETSAGCDIIFTVVTRLELRKLKNLVHDTDPHAFVFANTIREASGGILRRRQQH